MACRGTLIGLSAALACALFFASTATALGPILTVKVSKQKASGYGTTTKVNVDKNEKVSLWYRVKNVSPGDLDYSFDDDGEKIPEDLSIKWFKGKTNISHDVQTAGHSFSVKSGKSKLFRAQVRADANNITHCVVGHGSYSGSIHEYAYGGVNDDCIN